jgi:hypothetical protein
MGIALGLLKRFMDLFFRENAGADRLKLEEAGLIILGKANMSVRKSMSSFPRLPLT